MKQSPVMTRKLIFLAVLFAAALLAATPEQAVLDAEKSWSTAVVAGDTSTLDRVLGDDLSYGHASGAHDTKKTYIDRIRSGAQKYLSFQYDEGATQVRVYGTTAVLIASAQIRSLTDGVENKQHLRFLHVYVRHNGDWQLVAHQSVKLPK
jgi:ketosteroid isomerase-like protein